MPHFGRELQLERLIARPEVKSSRTFFNRRDQQLAQEHLAGRSIGQLDREAWLVPKIAAAIIEPVVKSNRSSIPFEFANPQPTSMGRQPRQALIELSESLVVKFAAFRFHRPTADMLTEEFVELRINYLAIAHVADIERPGPAKEILTLARLLLIGHD